MSNFLDKMQVNTAITDNTKLDLSHQKISTTDFFELQPSMFYEMVPGSKISVDMESFARLNPMPVPTFGRASWIHRAFFIPYRLAFAAWNDFLADTVHVPSTMSSPSAIVSSVPTVSNDTLVKTFINNSYGVVDITDDDAVEAAMASSYMVFSVQYTAGSPVPPHDITYVTSGTSSYYNFTTKGRQAFKVLTDLGYKVVWSGNKQGDADFYDATYSALNLLCLAKLYTDWYWPTQYTNLASYDDLVSLTKKDNDCNTFILAENNVRTILRMCVYSQYSPDMFTAAWDRPNSPSSYTNSNFKLVNIDTVGSVYFSNSALLPGEPGYVSNNQGTSTVDDRIGAADAPFITPYIRTTSGSSSVMASSISEYLLHGLHAMTDYLKRNQLVGSKAGDRLLARYGKALPAEKINRSLYLGAHNQDIQIGDVMSTADSAGAALGAYAGKGISYGTGQFEFSTDEFGLFIIMSSLIPNVGYFQGIDPTVKRLGKLDFWTPEYDALAVSAVAADELYVPNVYSSSFVGLPEQVFGYLPTYYDYKIKLDSLSGNFLLNSINGINPGTSTQFNAANSWHLMRVFDSQDYTQASDIVHGAAFIDAKNDMSQYKRIFYDVNASAPDNFTCIHNFNVAVYAPMKSLFDVYEFEDKGKKITEDVNGVKMN